MSGTSKKQIELYTVVALIAVAAVLAYFRFLRKPATEARPPPATALAESASAIPQLPEWLKGGTSEGVRERLPYAAPRRDLFAPSSENPPDAAPLSTGSPGSMDGIPVLSATMQGAQGALAIINGRIVGKGEVIGAFTVAEIRDDAVVLLRGTTRYVLKRGK